MTWSSQAMLEESITAPELYHGLSEAWEALEQFVSWFHFFRHSLSNSSTEIIQHSFPCRQKVTNRGIEVN